MHDSGLGRGRVCHRTYIKKVPRQFLARYQNAALNMLTKIDAYHRPIASFSDSILTLALIPDPPL